MYKFSSSFAEREYLRNASPSEAFKYLDRISQSFGERRSLLSPQPLPEDTQKILFERNDPLIDIGLVKLVDDDLIQQIINRHCPKDLSANSEESTLSSREEIEKFNKVLTSAFSSTSVGNLFSTPRWLESQLEWIAYKSDLEQLQTLLNNPNLANELIEQILQKKDWCENLDNAKHTLMLRLLLKNKIIEVEPKDDHDYDMSQHGIISSCWMLLVNLERNKETASLIAENIHKFQELEIPYSYSEKEDDAGDWKQNAVTTRKKFLGEMLSKWTCLPEEDDKYGNFKWNCDRIRSFTVEKIGSFYLNELKGFLFATDDKMAIEGYYAGVDLSSIKIEKFAASYQKYGVEFLFGLCRNKDIFRKSSKHSNALCLKLLEATKEFEKPDHMDDWNTPFAKFHQYFEIRKEQDPTKFLNDIGDLYSSEEKSHDSESDLNQKFLEIQRSIASFGNKNADTLKASDLASLFEIVNKKLDLVESGLDKYADSLSVFSDGIGKRLDQNSRSIQNKFTFLALFIGFLLGWILM
jgi:hypothetical protein